MATFEITGPNGERFRITGDRAPTEQELQQLLAAQPVAAPAEPVEGNGFMQRVGKGLAAVVEPAVTAVTGAAAQPISGLAGIVGGILPGPEGQSADFVRRTQEALTIAPTSESGQRGAQAAAEVIEPVAGALQAVQEGSGQVFESAGEAIGGERGGALGRAFGEALPAAVEIAVGGVLSKGAGKLRRAAKAEPTAEQRAIIAAGEELKTPVLTTDVVPPQSFAGKSLQQLSEKLGPLGTGPKRVAQQRARSDVVVELADEFNAELDTPFEADVIKSLTRKNAEELALASQQRNAAVDALTPLGEVPVRKTMQAINDQLAKQSRLGDKANQGLIDNLNSIANSVQNRDFSILKDVRQEVISDIKAVSRGEDRRALATLQNIKSAIDKDMVAFARKANPEAAKDWLRSNRKFAFELGRTRNTELKRLLEKGEVTPEVITPILRGGKVSELQRLRRGLTDRGVTAAQGAIIRDALKDSGFFSGNINPDRLATILSRPNTQKAVGVFFEGAQKKRLDGLVKMLDATRRAQQAALTTPTGQSLIPVALIGGGVTEPMITLLTAGTLGAVTKGLESKPVRDILIKFANAKKGSKAEMDLLRSVGPAVVAAQQSFQATQQEDIAP